MRDSTTPEWPAAAPAARALNPCSNCRTTAFPLSQYSPGSQTPRASVTEIRGMTDDSGHYWLTQHPGHCRRCQPDGDSYAGQALALTRGLGICSSRINNLASLLTIVSY